MLLVSQSLFPLFVIDPFCLEPEYLIFQHLIPGCGDHGIKAQGDGWLLTVALIGGSNLAAVGSGGISDPYLVFTCNGKSRTSSIKFQTCDPLWNGVSHVM